MDNNSEPNKLTRRNILVTSGAVIAGNMVSPAFAHADDRKSEIDSWKELVGQRFLALPVGQKSTTNKKLQLVAVREIEFDDPDRPAEFREPFCLHFDGMGRSIPDGTYVIGSRKVGRYQMLLTNVVDFENGDEVVEAVLG